VEKSSKGLVGQYVSEDFGGKLVPVPSCLTKGPPGAVCGRKCQERGTTGGTGVWEFAGVVGTSSSRV
jgi:hypothetical protein